MARFFKEINYIFIQASFTVSNEVEPFSISCDSTSLRVRLSNEDNIRASFLIFFSHFLGAHNWNFFGRTNLQTVRNTFSFETDLTFITSNIEAFVPTHSFIANLIFLTLAIISAFWNAYSPYTDCSFKAKSHNARIEADTTVTEFPRFTMPTLACSFSDCNSILAPTCLALIAVVSPCSI